MRNKASRAIFDYWANLRGDRAAPLRTEIDPVALRHLLPHLFIVTTDATGLLTFRLAGTRICDLFDREFRGEAFAEAWLENEYRQPAEIVQNVIHYERPAYLEVLASNGDLRHAYEMLLLPIRSTEGNGSDRVLGALLPQGQPFPTTELPVSGLVLESWTFLVESGVLIDAPPSGDNHGFGEALLRRLFSSHGQTS
ncbi:PAS domain-containing protein [Neorhizobium petrolearium]|uniref:PAS domain-containing protein n=1 Tax=Neorhizobium petrolearium TaxID=515361 RepID=A0ABY8M8N9_9HYPH|nr:PAS domain-containing protein [Neorhizobium petrolearium]MCC2610196.1 PAS domain-containing protein [Neorhizobium petrolearium]WGI70356.1 PAS domain-containing protein [Neorhizobium petrolearium]